MSGERFDSWQFEGRHQVRAVSAESKISFDDYTRSMKTEFRAEGRGWVPPFALVDWQLRKVLLKRTWRYCHNCLPMPERIDWEKLNKEATARLLKTYKIKVETSSLQKQMHTDHVRAALSIGGYMQLESSIAWQRWRLGSDSVAIAEALNITPGTVRIHLARLRSIARELHFDVGQPHHSYRSKRHSQLLKKAWRRRRKQGIPTSLA
jgi:hypothetical protein